MKQPDWSESLYDRQHEIWPGWSASDGDAADAAAFLQSWLELSPGSRVLDLGCGAGREVAALAALGHCVTGLDRSPALVERARQRLQSRGLAAEVSVGDLLELHGMETFDVIYLWDSTLNIFDLQTAGPALGRLVERLNTKGWLVTQQLHDAYWKKPRPAIHVESAAIGPGRTERQYRFEEGVLHDEVLHFASGAATPEKLPVQRLQLFPVPDLLAVLRGLGLTEVQARGSSGFSWARTEPVSETTPMVAFAGRRVA
jgi:SAM-dependent methyltransferase